MVSCGKFLLSIFCRDPMVRLEIQNALDVKESPSHGIIYDWFGLSYGFMVFLTIYAGYYQ